MRNRFMGVLREGTLHQEGVHINIHEENVKSEGGRVLHFQSEIRKLKLDGVSTETSPVIINRRLEAERAFIALANAQLDLDAGFTTVADMDSRGRFNTV